MTTYTLEYDYRNDLLLILRDLTNVSLMLLFCSLSRQDETRVATDKRNVAMGRFVVLRTLFMVTPLGLQYKVVIALSVHGSALPNLGHAVLVGLAKKDPLATVSRLGYKFEVGGHGRQGIDSCRRQVVFKGQAIRTTNNGLGDKAIAVLDMNSHPIGSYGMQINLGRHVVRSSNICSRRLMHVRIIVEKSRRAMPACVFGE